MEHVQVWLARACGEVLVGFVCFLVGVGCCVP